MNSNLKLSRKGDAVFASRNGSPPVEVKLLFARPISARDGQISILDRENKEELAWLNSLDELDPASQRIARQALDTRYPVSRITSVEHSFVNHGHRYLKVMTNRGFRYFNLKEPGKNVTWLSDDKLVIRDSMGNRFEIESISSLDPESRKNLNLVL